MRRVLSCVLVVTAACSASTRGDDTATAQQAVYDCDAVDQRFTCAEPTDADRRFVCHATGNGYVKISVPRASSTHEPGVAHGDKPADQSPGASANDLGGGVGLDCECNERLCDSACTGASEGTACDDGDRCTGEGTCSESGCEPGVPSCTAGAPVDACNVQSGTCDPQSGACGTDPQPAGTPCGTGMICDGAGTCEVIPPVFVNEVESSGGVPGDWVELYNSGTTTADVSGWRFLDSDNTHTAYVIPAGTTIAAGGTLVLDEAAFGFGLGGADSARLFDDHGVLIDSYAWTAHAVTTYGRCPDGSGAFRATTAPTKGTPNDCSVAVKVNEVESSGGVPGDWVELYNAGGIAVDLSGWRFRDSDNTRQYTIPAGTTIAPGAFLVLDEAQFGFGLGSADSARVFDSSNVLVDGYSWTAHAVTTYGRCPSGSGAFTTTTSVTKGAANACGDPPGPPPGEPWPGRNAVTTVDEAGSLGSDVSGLFREGGTLWAVNNGTGQLLRLAFNGSIWVQDTIWNLRYPDGTGMPDSEDVTRAELESTAIYVVAERNNAANTVSRLSVLRYDTAQLGDLVATHEWNLTPDLPAVGPNQGLEAITWVPDDFLVANSFFDERAGHTYVPAEYPGHGGGLFFVGVEATGAIHVYALDHAGGGFTRIATIASGNPGVMATTFDRDVGYLWVACDDTCAGQTGVLRIDVLATSPTFGRFRLVRQYARPSTMPNLNNEGIAIASEAQCVAGLKSFLWTNDSPSDGHALREDSIPCGAFLP